jgi:hypothetical protein
VWIPTSRIGLWVVRLTVLVISVSDGIRPRTGSNHEKDNRKTCLEDLYDLHSPSRPFVSFLTGQVVEKEGTRLFHSVLGVR